MNIFKGIATFVTRNSFRLLIMECLIISKFTIILYQMELWHLMDGNLVCAYPKHILHQILHNQTVPFLDNIR